MEDLDFIVCEQKKLGKTIENFISNVGKEPVSRRTLVYYETKLVKLNELDTQFSRNHAAIVELAGDDGSHRYFTSKYYDQVALGVEVLQQSMTAHIQRLKSLSASAPQANHSTVDLQENEGKQTSASSDEPNTSRNANKNQDVSFSTTPNQESSNDKVCGLVNRQVLTMRMLRHLLENIQVKSSEEHSIHYYDLQMKSINTYWSTIAELNLSVWELIGLDSEPAGFSMEDYFNLEEEVNENLLGLAEKRASLTVSHSQPSQLKLPQISIPVFNGDYLKWQQFYDTYTQMVHNSGMPNSDKMFYLNNNLAGEAKALVQHLPVSTENYSAAWKILTNRYNNKRILINALLNKLLSQPTSQYESASAIRSLHDVTTECTLGLENLGINIESWDAILLHLLIAKLDKTTHNLYEQSLKRPNEPQNLKDFLSFLEVRFQSLDALGYKGQQKQSISMKCQKNNNSKSSFSGATSQIKCKLCADVHPLYYCQKFLQMTSQVRLKKLKELKLCINCLKEGHYSTDCASGKCKTCDRRHNSLVHAAFGKETSRPQSDGSKQTSKPQSDGSKHTSRHQSDGSNQPSTSNNDATVSIGVQIKGHTFLATAMVYALDNSGRQIKCRALLDSGSQVNLVTKNLSKRLGLEQADSDMNITGIGGSKQLIQKRTIVVIKSQNSLYSRQLEAFILNKIIEEQPIYDINPKSFNIPKNLQLADPNFYKSQRIDLLLGAEFYSELMKVGQISPTNNTPTLQNTVFGWVVLGKAKGIQPSVQVCGVNTLDDQLQRFWEMDEIPSKDVVRSKTEQACENFFSITTCRNKFGRFIVRLPFKDDLSLRGSSKETAKRRFLALERRLSRNKSLQQEYAKFMNEYENLGHMELVDEDSIKEPNYFIPHHCVLKPMSTTTKLRVVFDASCKTSSNVALNQILHKGPKIQTDLFDILIRFRQYTYVFTSDIEKMYRQIRVNSFDMNFQLIFCRNDPQQKLNIYRLTTVTYGTTSAPYLAMKCLQSLGAETASKYPFASEMVKTDFYVDDLMSGSDDLQTAINMQSEVIDLLSSAGFKLRKWCANHQALLERILPGDIERTLDIAKESAEGVKTLGISWDPTNDIIAIKTSWNEQKRVTKRTVLADVAQIFDPVGLLSPVVIVAKIFIQELWKGKYEWDAALPMHLNSKWLDFRRNLKQLDKVVVPRHVRGPGVCTQTQLHVFADASERAFGAVIYVRSVDQDDVVNVKLLCSKSRVAPCKIITIPRLELQVAKLATELCHQVNNSMKLNDADIYYWTDSQIVLHWLNSESSSFKTFVANRISYIQRHSSIPQWTHVSSPENPADDISRGVTPECLLSNERWFNGPHFLKQPVSEWPGRFELKEDCIEERKCTKSILTVSCNEDHFVFQIDHKNSFSFLVRTTYALRFIKTISTNSPRQGHILMSEVRDAFFVIIKALQASQFRDEIKELTKSGTLEKKNRLSSLTPFIDEMGVMRVGGRLESATLTFDAKHPILLPANHIFTYLIMEELHVQHYHVGPQTLLAITRQRFWPINGKRIANKLVHKCMKCFRARPTAMTQLMGNLPSSRIQACRPFLNTGVDFAGPIWTHFKIRGKRPQKSYIAVFCCFATKAIHLEVVSDLSADGFIGALRRFWSRRGRCKTIYSDNATNFVGGANQLQELYDVFNSRPSAAKIFSECIDKGVEFQFIPPRAPHFGGLWESAVKSTKNLLYKSMKAASLTYEELSTVTTEIEAILNSRPLTPLSSDPNDMSALTPAHLLIGEPITTIVDPAIEVKNINSLTRWKLVSYLKSEFWRRWKNEYLSTLQQRYKWRTKCQNAVPGLMVLLREDNTPPACWRLGRIEKTYKGLDNLIRVADVKTANGILRRPIHKLCPLPSLDQNSPQLTSNSQIGDDQAQEKESIVEPSMRREKVLGSTNRSISSVAAILLTLLVMPIYTKGNSHPSINISYFESNPGLYFESLGLTNLITNEWHLVVFYDLQNYWEELNGFVTGIERLSQLCSSMKSETHCRNVLALFEHNLGDIKVYNEVLLGSNTSGNRAKRGAFDIVGTVANRLFGVLDVEYAEKMSSTIQAVDKNERKLFNLVNNHTILLEATTNVIKNTQQQINQQFNSFANHLNEIQKNISDVDTYLEQQNIQYMFAAVAVQMLLIMNNFQKVQTSLIDIITDSDNGKINPLLITPVQLKSALLSIKNNLSPDLKLPFYGSAQVEVSTVYSLLHVQGRMSKENIIFRIQFPIASSNQFEMFHLIPIPVKVDQDHKIIKPSSSYLIISLHRDLFYPTSESEERACVRAIPNNILCKQSQPLYNRHSSMSRCEMALLNHQPPQSLCNVVKSREAPEFIQLSNSNHWIFSVNKNVTISIVCQDETSTATLHGTGLLKISGSCVIKEETLMLTAHNVHPTQIRSSFTPAIDMKGLFFDAKNHDHQEVIKSPEEPVIRVGGDEITNIQEQLQQIKLQQAEPEQLNVHDVHQYAISYISLMIGVIITAALISINIKSKGQKAQDTGPVPAPRNVTACSNQDFTFNVNEVSYV